MTSITYSRGYISLIGEEVDRHVNNEFDVIWKMPPPVALGNTLIKELPDFRMLLWVDFTANRVRFAPG